MKQAEKQRIVAMTQAAVEQITAAHAQLKARAEKIAKKFSPTNFQQFTALVDIVWWLIAVDAYRDALRLIDALCELDDEIYWTYCGLADAYATRAWLKLKLKDAPGARRDAHKALGWIARDPNGSPVTEDEARKALSRFDGFVERADGEKGTIMALTIYGLAMRILVKYQQFAKVGDAGAKCVPAREYASRLSPALKKMKARLEC